MKKHISSIRLYTMVFLIILLFTGCGQKTPPNIDEIYREFQDNQESFQLVADYFSSVSHQSIFINHDDDYFWADFRQYPFDEMDIDVYNTICCMFKEKGYYGISKNNTQLGVVFRMWTDYRSIDCGVVYAIRNDAEPQPEFVVELIPLQEEGWYYYVSDYNEWRSQQIHSD